jgi:hypothetical protein
MSTVKNIDYNKRAKINAAIITVFLALGYFASQVPAQNQQTPIPKDAINYTNVFGDLHININKPITNEECAAYILKALSNISPEIETIFVFDDNGQVCFSNLKRDSGIVYTREIFK